MMPRPPVLLLSVLALLGAGAAQAADGTGSPVAIPVSTAPAVLRDVPVYLSGIGAVQAYNTVAIHPQVDGQLLKVLFTEGQDVQAGQPLAQIDPRPFQAALDQANAKRSQDVALLDNAKRDVDRYGALVERNYISRQQLDNARAQVAQLQAAVQGDDAAIQSARIQLGYTTIRAPIDGRAGLRQVDAGNIVHASGGDGGHSGGVDTLVVLTQQHPMAVVFALNQEDLPRLLPSAAQGKPEVTVFGKDSTQALDTGRLAVVDNQIDPTSGTVRLKAIFPNKDSHLWPGQFVTARVLVATQGAAVTVPATAVLRGDQGEYVYVVNAANVVDTRPVQSGPSHGDVVVIQRGLSQGEEVVRDGQFRLKPGAKVAVDRTKTAAEKRE